MAIAGGPIAIPVVVLVGSVDHANTRGRSPSPRPPDARLRGEAGAGVETDRSHSPPMGMDRTDGRLAAAELATRPRGFMPPGTKVRRRSRRAVDGSPGAPGVGVSGGDQAAPCPPADRDGSTGSADRDRYRPPVRCLTRNGGPLAVCGWSATPQWRKSTWARSCDGTGRPPLRHLALPVPMAATVVAVAGAAIAIPVYVAVPVLALVG